MDLEFRIQDLAGGTAGRHLGEPRANRTRIYRVFWLRITQARGRSYKSTKLVYLRLPHQITSEKQKLLTSVEKKSAGLRSMHTGMHMFIRLMMETTSHRFLARGVINGEYVPCGCDGQVDMTKFRKTTNGRNGNFEVFLRFLDARGDPGWHFCSGNRGRKFAWNPQCSPLPPSDGWKDTHT